MTVDMSPEAVARRLEQVSRLRTLCLSLGTAGHNAGLHSTTPGVREKTEPYPNQGQPFPDDQSPKQ